MAVWVCANMSYSDVLKQIAPLESQLTKLKEGLADSQARLSQCQQELGQLDEQVSHVLRCGVIASPSTTRLTVDQVCNAFWWAPGQAALPCSAHASF